MILDWHNFKVLFAIVCSFSSPKKISKETEKKLSSHGITPLIYLSVAFDHTSIINLFYKLKK